MIVHDPSSHIDEEPPWSYLDELPPPEHQPPAIPYSEFTRRDWYIYRIGQQDAHEARQWEVDAAWNAHKRSEDYANRYYRAAFDHEYHDCAVHAYKGPYQGAATRLVDDAYEC